MSELRNKSVSFRANRLLTAWRLFASSAEFAGMNADDLQAEIQSAQEVRQQIQQAEARLSGLRQQRDQEEDALSRRVTAIVNSLRGHLDYGDDCSFYRAIGYVPTSEQRRGRPRKAK